MTTTSADAFGAPGAPEAGPARKRRTAIAAVAAVGAAAVIGGGAYAVTRVMGGGGDQPASALPAGTAAYFRVDIDPSMGQKVAALRFLEGLDDDKLEAIRSGDWREQLVDYINEQDPEADLDYQRDFEPWLGDRAAVGVVPDGDDTPMVVAALQIKRGVDVQDTESGLEALRSEGLTAFVHGEYYVITGADDEATLRDELQAGTLAEDATFQDDVRALGDEGVASMWMDIAQIDELTRTAVEDLEPGVMPHTPGAGGLAGMLSGVSGEQPAPEGRVAAAVRFSADSVEVHGVARGYQPVELEEADTAHLVLDLPADTPVAYGGERGDQFVRLSWDAYEELMPEELAEFERMAREAGFELPSDLQTLVGSSSALAVGPGIVEAVEAAEGSAVPELPLAYQSQTDAEEAEELVDRLLALAGLPDDMVARSVDNDVLTVGLDQGYVDEVAAEGRLGAKEQFTTAVADAEKADGVFYVDVNAFEDYYLPEVTDERAREGLSKLAAVGIRWAYTDDSESEFTLRLVADQAD